MKQVSRSDTYRALLINDYKCPHETSLIDNAARKTGLAK